MARYQRAARVVKHWQIYGDRSHTLIYKLLDSVLTFYMALHSERVHIHAQVLLVETVWVTLSQDF